MCATVCGRVVDQRTRTRSALSPTLLSVLYASLLEADTLTARTAPDGLPTATSPGLCLPSVLCRSIRQDSRRTPPFAQDCSGFSRHPRGTRCGRVMRLEDALRTPQARRRHVHNQARGRTRSAGGNSRRADDRRRCEYLQDALFAFSDAECSCTRSLCSTWVPFLTFRRPSGLATSPHRLPSM